MGVVGAHISQRRPHQTHPRPRGLLKIGCCRCPTEGLRPLSPPRSPSGLWRLPGRGAGRKDSVWLLGLRWERLGSLWESLRLLGGGGSAAVQPHPRGLRGC